MSKTQSKVRAINREIAKNNNIEVSDVEPMIASMWETTKEVIESSMYNAIYLRFLGTFYSKDSIRNQILRCREEKNDTR